MNKFLFTSALFLSLFSIGISSAFAASYNITSSAGAGGSVSPSGTNSFTAGQPSIAPTYGDNSWYDPGQAYIAPWYDNPGQPYIAPSGYHAAVGAMYDNPGQSYIAPTAEVGHWGNSAPLTGSCQIATDVYGNIIGNSCPGVYDSLTITGGGQIGNNCSDQWAYCNLYDITYTYHTTVWVVDVAYNPGQPYIAPSGYHAAVGAYYDNPGQAYIAPSGYHAGQAYIAPSSGGGVYLISAGQAYIAPSGYHAAVGAYYDNPGQPSIAPSGYHAGQAYIAPSSGGGVYLISAGQAYIAPANQTYTITPSTGYSISSVTVDGGGQGAIGSYTFSNIQTTHTISATFVANSYGVTWNSATGGSASGVATCTYNTTVTPTCTPSTGYSTASCAAFTCSTSNSFTPSFSVNSYTITFNTNGGNGGSTVAESLVYNTPTALTTNGFTKTGYSFVNWNTAANGSGTSYANGASYTIGAAGVTLYAQWSVNSYAVIFNTNGGNGGSTAAESLVYNTPTVLTTNGFTRTGYTFTGWNTAANGSGTAYADVASYTIGAAAVTLYAQWSVNSYTVTFDGNGSNGGSTTVQSLVYNTPTALRTNGFTRTGYTFSNWNTQANGSGTTYANGASYTIGTAGVTLYSQWSLNTQSALSITSTSVTYPNTLALTTSGGSGSGGVSYVVNSGSCTVSGSTLTPTGAGSCSVTATKAGDGVTYLNGVSSSPTTITINPAAQTASISTASAVYTGSAIARAVTCSGGGTATPATVSGTTVGTYTATISCAASGNYATTSGLNPGSFSITGAPQTASLSPTSVTYNGGSQSATVTCSGSGTPTPATVSGTNVGTYTATISCAASGNYAVTGSLNPGNFSITAASATPTTQTTDTDFNAGTKSSTAVTGSGTSGSVALSTYAVAGQGQQAYTTPGTYSWTAPAGVTSVSVVAVGGGGGGSYSDFVNFSGGGGGGGGLAYKNNYTVIPGNNYTVFVGNGGNAGSSGSDSYFVNSTTVVKGGGGISFGTSPSGGNGGNYIGTGGGNGGNGGGGHDPLGYYGGGGGGTGGYSGDGSHGGTGGTGGITPAGTGGSASGGGYNYGGGGVGILGQGTSGASASEGGPGKGGSSGADGTYVGGAYGGGGRGGTDGSETPQPGAKGAVRIIWGPSRSFPSINTGDMSTIAGSTGYFSPGTFTSSVIDIGVNQKTTTLNYSTTLNSQTITMDVRAGNTATPDGTWSVWQTGIADGGSLAALASYRYVQYRANLSTSNTAVTPTLDSVTINTGYKTYTLTLPASGGTGAGSYSGTSAGSVNYGTGVTVTATPNTGSSFSTWTATGAASSCNGSAINPCTFAMTGAASVTANYAVSTFTLTVTTGANGSASGPSGTYNYGQVVTLTATPNANYYLVGWTGDADCSDGSVTMTANVSCTANFVATTIYQDPVTGTSVSSLAANQATLSWTNPSSPGSTIMIVRSLSPITTSPINGTVYIVGSNIDIGTSVVYMGGVASTFVDSGLTGGFSYYYKIFAKNLLYYSAGVSPTGSPVIVLGSAPAINQIGYIWRNDNSSGSSAVSSNTALSSGVYVGDRRRLRFQITNGSAYAANGYNYRLEYSVANPSCTVWNPVPVQGTYTNQPWLMDVSPYISNGFATSHYSGLTTQFGSFASGLFNSLSNETTMISLPASSYSELEYSLKSTSNAVPGSTYCFRLTNGGSTSSFTYSNIPQILLQGVTARPEHGGGNLETPSAPSGAVNSGQGGGGESAPSVPSSPIETTVPTAPPVQGTPSGSGGSGGGDVGILYSGMNGLAAVGKRGQPPLFSIG